MAFHRQCSVCRHGAHADIDRALAQGDSLRRIAVAHGVSKDALWRHRVHANRVPEADAAVQFPGPPEAHEAAVIAAVVVALRGFGLEFWARALQRVHEADVSGAPKGQYAAALTRLGEVLDGLDREQALAMVTAAAGAISREIPDNDGGRALRTRLVEAVGAAQTDVLAEGLRKEMVGA